MSPTIIFTEPLDNDQLRPKHIGRELIQYGDNLPASIQINWPTRWNSFTSLLLDDYVSLNMFRVP
jgi:hypothetical protein